VSKSNALRQLKEVRRDAMAAYRDNAAPRFARMSLKRQKVIKRRLMNRVLVKP
jgi:hypothetical protein